MLRMGLSKLITGDHARARENANAAKPNYWSEQMANGWSMERRQLQALMIRRWQPWKRSTGPKTPAGKAISARNGYKGGSMREKLRRLREELEKMEAIENEIYRKHAERIHR
jgi:hypothetical protein